MIVWISLVGGIVLGWLIEWLIDWLYWRRGVEAFYRRELELRRELKAAQEAARTAQAEAADLRTQLHDLDTTPEPVISNSASAASPVPTET